MYSSSKPMMNYQTSAAPTAPYAGPSTWSTGLFDCFSDPALCCLTCCCPCITFGRIAEIVDKGTTPCIASGGVYLLLSYLTGCGCMFSCCYRSKMKNQYNMEKDPCGDCLVHFCCESCALCQEYRELQNRGFEVSLGWEGNMSRQNPGVVMAPVVPGGMSK
jgi:Cys-rich protein (TIGR01571 family)